MIDQTQQYHPFPIVGVAVSPRDTETIQQFFSEVSPTSNIAYLVLRTTASQEERLSAETLQSYTSVPVCVAVDDEVILPNYIYIIPSQTNVHILNGKIQLQPNSEDTILSPIDSCFHSLAQHQGNKAAAVILSAMGSDGTTGIKAIKFQDGLVLVQLEETASYQQMPQNAVLTGATDATLPPSQIPRTIEQYFQHQNISSQDTELVETSQEWLERIFTLLRSRIGHDFTAYKRNTLIRRITRRMNLRQIETYEDYTNFLQKNPEEVKALFRECLIGVTSFFRNPPAFNILKQQFLPPLLNSLSEGDTFRAWIPACYTGEEVYSLAIILQEIIDSMNKDIKLQLFGTDIDQRAIEKARQGIFPLSIQAEVTPKYLERFFERDNQFYYINQIIRNSIVFSIQNILKDPPFSRLHFLSCRNLLIYLEPETQKKIIPLFHYTLNPSGILMLGSSESIGSFQDLFSPLDHRWKIFKRRHIKEYPRQVINFPTGSQLNLSVTKTSTSDSCPKDQETNLETLIKRKLLNEFCPTAILIETNGDIIHIQGRTGKFLEIVSGYPTNNIINLARKGLKFELFSAIQAAISSEKSVTRQQIPVNSNGNTELVKLQVEPLDSPPPLAGRLLVILNVIESHSTSNEQENIPQDIALQQKDNRIAQLEKELQDTRESHQTTIEELESSNEELQATNEELESSNEELQATNEELESSKEELQSLNEELQTLNQELQSTINELSVTQNDLRNLLNITEVATIIVDHQMRVKRFTPEVTNIMPLIPTDIGRPIHDVTTNLNDDGMVQDILEVLQTLTPKTKLVETREGGWYRMEITPYRKDNYQIEGTVVNFININELKQKEEALKQAQLLQQSLLDTYTQPAILLTNQLEIININLALQNQLTIEQVEEKIIKPLEIRLQNNEPFEETISFSLDNERPYRYLVRCSIIPDQETRIKYCLLFLTNL
ncbi:chemotaxis protein CheR [Euhalothece natronophila Z-M001]|uniref:protein-glutamate O-methyltransferase n=1 Tax=Euhalothece natronophila Z-M001 TaxID=522448 RepID=A0A5B8NRY9_9CHRO|nr:CheR family methyltransferase [Euhalothece natronophila]QDZ40850.1 chemotaxis protein CheR [Euhalothece natronophila Z-M001]